jgi:5-methylcytosine-specific restriction endonuclease McrA
MPKGLYKRTEEIKNKIRKSLIGRKHTEETKRKMSTSRMGHPTSKETRIKIGLAHKGKIVSREARKKLSIAHIGQVSGMKGKKHSLATRLKLHIATSSKRGNKASGWKGGLTKKDKLIRNSKEYADWRMKVFVRDNFTCVECRKIGCYLEAHHIKSFADYPEFRFEISNGVSLCKDCHEKTDNYSWKNRKGGNCATTKKG